MIAGFYDSKLCYVSLLLDEMAEMINITPNERKQLITGDAKKAPKYTFYALNNAVKYSSANQKPTIGKITEIYEEFDEEHPDGSFEDWRNYYYNHYNGRERLNEATEQAYDMFLTIRAAIDEIDREDVRDFVEGLVLNGTYSNQNAREAAIEKGEYQYFVHPVSDGVPMLEPELLREIVIRIIRKAELENVDKIVTPAAMGIHISTAVSLMTDIPLVVIRKRSYGLEGEVSLSQQTGYSKSEMYINDVEEGDRVLVLDDVLSTGGTMNAILDALVSIGTEVVDVVAVIKKAGPNKLDDTDYRVKTLINVTVENGEVVIVDPMGDS